MRTRQKSFRPLAILLGVYCNGLNASGQINGTRDYFTIVNTDGILTNLRSLVHNRCRVA
jgi:hypothetical protein